MNLEKEQFLKTQFGPLLKNLKAGQVGKWGKMDAQQMVEHFRQSLKVANGKIQLPLHNPDAELLQKKRQFVMSDLEFRENTKSPVLAENTYPHKFGSLQEAIEKLEVELKDVFEVYEKDRSLELMNPVFGSLNYEMQIQLLHKHAMHHLKQFDLL